MDEIDLSNEKTWPSDGPNHVFIARALNLIGAATLGEAWKGNELTSYSTSLTAIPRPWMKKDDSKKFPISDLLNESLGDITEEEQFEAKRLVQENNDEVLAARSRFDDALKVLSEYCIYRKLYVAIRLGNGTFADIDSGSWSTGAYHEWVRAGCASIAEALDTDQGGDILCPLFVQQDGLNEHFPASGPAPSDLSDIYLSPYIRLMIDVVRKYEITDKNHSKIDVLVKFILDEFPKRGLPVSDKLATSMATLVRSPAAQSGGLRKIKTHKKG